MSATDYIVIGVIAVIIACAIAYIVWAKKNGKKCIGCPDSSSCQSGGCSGSCSSCQGCSTHVERSSSPEESGSCPHCKEKGEE